ncbi:LuxR C-terminal-related transcriptional regulator [Hoeflea sp. YIM 152468]|uniref:helix-turn-helix transcriptional regulator n=1 Tax=Hoeflea sp. YIM 152468 TaxID=3031759 RepID=UPI0023D97F08|nr:LuxR C-terminal-related transcriptional regulator [Hoeflea sp. YIM 152468]MDF1610038.1 LuxR C-terminal-related transcriptional regulator [Hoeflea sp. YIM 152468]
MLAPETVFHQGPELERAVNRMDFFRLFKSLAGSHGVQFFGVVEIPGETASINLGQAHVLHNFPGSWFEDGANCLAADPVVSYLQQSTAPIVLEVEGNSSAFVGDNCSPRVLVVPLQAASGKRYGLIMSGLERPVAHQQLALIALDAALIFQRYFEVLLSLDSISGLSEREIQIVRWTSEGKTSSEIAIILGLSEHTVNSYIAAVLRKLQVVNRAQMVAAALRSGLIS